MDNMVLEVIAKRRSIRGYSEEKLTDEQTSTLVEAALCSPSSNNERPWHISVVSDQSALLGVEKDAIEYFIENDPGGIVARNAARGNKLFYNAPTAFFISVNAADRLMDVGIVAQTICLAAKSLGLGSVILGLPKVAFGSGKWEKVIDFPDGYIYGIAVAVGHGNVEGVIRDRGENEVSYIK